MTGTERGFLLLCSHLGDPHRRPLTPARFRELARLVRCAGSCDTDRELEPADLKALGCTDEFARLIAGLLNQESRLDRYLRRAEKAGCGVLTPFSGSYPRKLEEILGPDAPPVLWYRGDIRLLQSPGIALVGSRDIHPPNAGFAREAGIQAARQGFTLVSGNARGADRIAQQACLASGGRVISILADSLQEHSPAPNQLLLCEDSFDLPFGIPRALSRNRLIHSLGSMTLVAQCENGTGGTWDGTAKHLRRGCTPVYAFDDGSPGINALAAMGAEKLPAQALQNLSALLPPRQNIFI